MDQTISRSSVHLKSKEEWLGWRSEGIGSSDAPIIMGVSPYMTPFQLWQVKTGKKLHVQDNMAIEKGNYWEPKVRAYYELLTGLEFPPKNFEDGALRCSLDGWNEERQEILEIKVPGKEVMDAARSGVVHEKYLWQLEHQLLVTQAKCVHFVCAETTGKGAYDGELGDVAVVHYRPDLDKREKLMGKLLEFWALVKEEKPPPLTEADTLERTDDKAKSLYSEYKKLYLEHSKLADQYEVIEEQMEKLKKEIIADMKHNKETCEGVQMMRVVQSRVDYSKLEEVEGIDLEKYKVEKVHYRVKVMK